MFFAIHSKKKGIFYGKHVSLPDVDPLKKKPGQLKTLIFHDLSELAGTVTLDQCQGAVTGGGRFGFARKEFPEWESVGIHGPIF